VNTLSNSLSRFDLKPGQHLIIAYSGGCDSQVLLHQVVALRDELDIVLTAAHVNHGLSLDAGQWATFCEQQCREFQVPLVQHQLQIKSNRNLEHQARQGRYAFFETLLEAGDILLTGHHLNDQAETILLRLLRGAGTKGLASIPVRRRLAKGWVIRPLLAASRAELEAYARSHQLSWVEDESNQSVDFDRNFLRHQVIPLLNQRWPQSVQTMAKSALNCRESTQLLAELGQIDLVACENPARASWLDLLTPLSFKQVAVLSPPRQENLIDAWLSDKLDYSLPKTRLREWLSQLALAQAEQAPLLAHEGIELRFYRGSLHCLKVVGGLTPIDWQLDRPCEMKALGLRLVASKAGTASLKRVVVQFRQGGERLSLENKAFSQALKKLFQAKQIPPWERDRLPMVVVDEEIIWTPWFGNSGSVMLGESNQVVEFELKRMS